MRLGIALATAGIALLAAGCGEKTTIRPEGAAKSVTDTVSKQTGFTPKDVKCPSDVEAKVGQKFECSFTGPEGPYTAFMEVRKVQGERVEFYIRTRPTG